jgi:Mor family transcriptional regulator
MAFLLPSKFRAPADQEVYSDFDESEYEEMVAKLTLTQQAIYN